jgi:hypothetical protein
MIAFLLSSFTRLLTIMLKFKKLDQLRADYNYYKQIYLQANPVGQAQLRQHLRKLREKIQWQEEKDSAIRTCR